MALAHPPCERFRKHVGGVTCPKRPVASPSVKHLRPRGFAMATVSNGVSFGRQAVRRDVNTRLRSVNGATETAAIEVFCECGRRLCADRLHIAIEVYDPYSVRRGNTLSHHTTTMTRANGSSADTAAFSSCSGATPDASATTDRGA